MTRRKWLLVILAFTISLSVEVVAVPIVPVLASPPSLANEVTCPSTSETSTSGPCTFTIYYYRGGGSLSYCFLGRGALYLHGEYYFPTEPTASAGRQVNSLFCPSMRG